MNDSIKRITLDVQQAHSKEIVYVKKTDTGRKLIIYLVDGSLPYHITSECQAIFTATRPRNLTPVVNTCAIENCAINYNIDPLITEITGRIPCEIVIYGADGKRLTAARFTIICEDIIYETGEDAETPLTKPMSILLAPENSKVGQFFQVKEVSADGRSVLLEAVDKPTIDTTVLNGKVDSDGRVKMLAIAGNDDVGVYDQENTYYRLALHSQIPDISGKLNSDGVSLAVYDDIADEFFMIAGEKAIILAGKSDVVLRSGNVRFLGGADGGFYIETNDDLRHRIEMAKEKTPLKIQIFGDSISSETWGDKATWVSKLPALLPDYELEIKNSAVGGNTLIHWVNGELNKGVAWQIDLPAMDHGVPEAGGIDEYYPLENDPNDPVDLVIIWAGSNDWGGTSIPDLIGDRSELFRPIVALEKQTLSSAAIDNTNKIQTGVGVRYSVDYFGVKAGQKVRIYGENVKGQLAWPLGGFSTEVPVKGGACTVIVSDDGEQSLLNSANEAQLYDFEYTVPENGYIWLSQVDTGSFNSLSIENVTLDVGCIYGAIRKIVETVTEANPATKMLFLTPILRWAASTADKEREQDWPVDKATGDTLNGGGLTQAQVADAIMDACAYYAIPCVDTYRTCGFNKLNYLPNGTFTDDGLHPNELGDERLAELVARAIKI